MSNELVLACRNATIVLAIDDGGIAYVVDGNSRVLAWIVGIVELICNSIQIPQLSPFYGSYTPPIQGGSYKTIEFLGLRSVETLA